MLKMLPVITAFAAVAGICPARPAAALQLEIPPDRVADLSVTGGNATSLTVGWSAALDQSWWGPEVKYYELRYSKVPIDDANFYQAAIVDINALPRGDGLGHPTPGTWLTYTIGGLIQGNTYFIAIKAVGYGIESSELSNVVSERTRLDWTGPAAVGDFTVAGTTPDSATLTWTATGDDGMSGTAASCSLRYLTAPIGPSNFHLAIPVPGPVPTGSPATFQSVTITGLATDLVYYFAIEVKDDEQNSSGITVASAFVGVTPPSDGDGGEKRSFCAAPGHPVLPALSLLVLGLALVRRR